mmetsp:Transcript_26705/g.77030  ORF Transcript_26705/g.77030 Transcript_26705/m.77030 type:complete len:231 (-) Transcript_26705:165-857(-)
MFRRQCQILGVVAIEPTDNVRCILGQYVGRCLLVFVDRHPLGENTEATHKVHPDGVEPVKGEAWGVHNLIGVGMGDGISHPDGIDVLRLVVVDLFELAGDGAAGGILSLRSAAELGEQRHHAVGIVPNIDGVHGHFVHEEDGTSLVVQDVVDVGTEGGALDAVVAGLGTEGAGCGHGQYRASLLVDLKADGLLDGSLSVGRCCFGCAIDGGRCCNGSCAEGIITAGSYSL